MSPVRSLFAGVLFAVGLMSGPATAQDIRTAVLAGGCFWCTEADMDKVPGVVSTISGYIGGTVKDPTYQQVSRGGTGHYEAVKVEYDPSKISYEQLLEKFWPTVDPTDGGGQFCDRGDQYRSAIFVSGDEERKIDCHQDPAGGGVLSRRRLSPGLLSYERAQI